MVRAAAKSFVLHVKSSSAALWVLAEGAVEQASLDA